MDCVSVNALIIRRRRLRSALSDGLHVGGEDRRDITQSGSSGGVLETSLGHIPIMR